MAMVTVASNQFNRRITSPVPLVGVQVMTYGWPGTGGLFGSFVNGSIPCAKVEARRDKKEKSDGTTCLKFIFAN